MAHCDGPIPPATMQPEGSVTRMLYALVLLLGIGSAATAQQAERRDLQLRASSFVFARYASGSASVLYAGRGLGPIGGFVGMVQNPKTQNRRPTVGSYTQRNCRPQGFLLGVA